LVDVDDVDLIYLKPKKAYELKQNIHKRLVWHDFTKKLVSKNIVFEPIRLTKEYELFLVYLPLTQDLINIPSIRGWKDFCRTSVCWIDEVWAAEVPKLGSWLSALNDFDHVVLSLRGTISAMSNAIKATCHFIPVAVDTLRFTPYPLNLNRVIDIYSMGRKMAEATQSLKSISIKEGLFYVYDTINASYADVSDYLQHRELLSNLAKRSRYFIVAPAKMDVPEETKNQIEVGLRYYEAAAAGAVMLGQVPDCETFNNMFNWPDSVIKVKSDGSDVAHVLSSLSAEPERINEISRRNATEALMRHDWVYRWKKILDIVGLRPTSKMKFRETKLKQMAEQLWN